MAAHEAKTKRASAQKADAAPTAEKDFSDPAVQRAILNPEGREIDLFGDTVKVYPLSARYATAFTGLAYQVISAAPNQGVGPAGMRFGSALVRHFQDDFIPLLARSLNKPGVLIDEAQVQSLAAEIVAKMTPQNGFLTLSAAFDLMCLQNDTAKALGLVAQPKN